MKAAFLNQYGPPEVISVQDVPKPTPKPGHALIKVHAASINAADWHYVRGEPVLARLAFGLRKPKDPIPGGDFAGVIEAIGPEFSGFAVGDAVYGSMAGSGWGAFAEYACAPAKVMAPVPTGWSYAQAAALPVAALTALQALRDRGQLKPGEQVMIHGASGGVGTYAVQVARALQGEVTAVCSTRNVQMARELGAHHVIDYKTQDFTKLDARYDVILAANGDRPLGDYKRALKPGGRYINVGGSNRQLMEGVMLAPLMSIGSNVKMGNMLATTNTADLRALNDLAAAGKLKSIISRTFTLDQVAQALQHVDEGHAQGKVVITI